MVGFSKEESGRIFGLCRQLVGGPPTSPSSSSSAEKCLRKLTTPSILLIFRENLAVRHQESIASGGEVLTPSIAPQQLIGILLGYFCQPWD